MKEAKKESKEITKAPDSPLFIVEDVADEPTQKEHLIDEDRKRIAKEVAKDALLLGSLVLIQIEDSPIVGKVTQNPTSQHQLGMPPLPSINVETPIAIQENIFSSLTPLHTLSTLTILDNVQGGVNQEIEKEE